MLFLCSNIYALNCTTVLINALLCYVMLFIRGCHVVLDQMKGRMYLMSVNISLSTLSLYLVLLGSSFEGESSHIKCGHVYSHLLYDTSNQNMQINPRDKPHRKNRHWE